MNRRVALGAFGAAVLGLFCQCNRSEPSPTRPASASAVASAPALPKRALVVFAAASLREAFGSLGSAFQAAHPGTTVTFHFAGSQELRTQIEHGAKADMFASADQRHMQALRDAHSVEAARIFAQNEPVVAVSQEGSAKISAFSDLPKAARIVIGAPEVPIGRYTLQILDRAEKKLGVSFRSAVEARVVSRELNVRQVLAKVSLGEAEAGIVYRSDVPSARGAVSLVAIPRELNVIAEYPIAPVVACAEPELAREFIALVLSPDGQSALKKAGFSVNAGAAVSP